MLIDELRKTIKEMTQLHNAETNAQNQEQMQLNDQSYKEQVNRLSINISIYQYAHENLKFNLSENVLQNLREALSGAEGVVEGGFVDVDLLGQLTRSANKTISSIQKEWSGFHKHNQPGYEGNLVILSGLTDDENELNRIRSNLLMASNWNNLSTMKDGKSTIERYKESIDEINNLLAQQNLTEDVKRFLKAVSAGDATFDYLTEDVMKWIHQQKIEDKLSITFTSSHNK